MLLNPAPPKNKTKLIDIFEGPVLIACTPFSKRLSRFKLIGLNSLKFRSKYERKIAWLYISESFAVQKLISLHPSIFAGIKKK